MALRPLGRCPSTHRLEIGKGVAGPAREGFSSVERAVVSFLFLAIQCFREKSSFYSLSSPYTHTYTVYITCSTCMRCRISLAPSSREDAAPRLQFPFLPPSGPPHVPGTIGESGEGSKVALLLLHVSSTVIRAPSRFFSSFLLRSSGFCGIRGMPLIK